jgi:peptidoglycan/xylan/chitin deacetylase (PgdA/CDA1 family)
MPVFFRAPAGLRNPFLEPVLARLGLTLASWSVRGFDTNTRNPALIEKRLQDGLRAGAILLVHDGNAALTVEGKPVILSVLPAILKLARTRGFRAVTLREAVR